MSLDKPEKGDFRFMANTEQMEVFDGTEWLVFDIYADDTEDLTETNIRHVWGWREWGAAAVLGVIGVVCVIGFAMALYDTVLLFMGVDQWAD